MAVRKRIRRRAERDHPGRLLGWRGGRLYFLDIKSEVDGIPHVPKPNREAIGWERAPGPSGPRNRADDRMGTADEWWRRRL